MRSLRRLFLLAGLALLLLAGARLLWHDGISTAPLGRDAAGRPTTPIRINGAGPFELVVDTGAEWTSLTPEALGRAAPWTIPFLSVEIVGTSGRAAGRAYLARSVTSAAFRRHLVPALELPNATVARDGALGVGVFRGRRLELDLAGGWLRVGPSGLPAGFVAVPGEHAPGDKLIVGATVDGVAARAVIDTGSRNTMANPALLRALGYDPGDPRLKPTDIGGATTDRLPASRADGLSLALGDVALDGVSVVFAAAPSFERAGLSTTPALNVGMDVLGRMRAVAVDFARWQLQLAR